MSTDQPAPYGQAPLGQAPSGQAPSGQAQPAYPQPASGEPPYGLLGYGAGYSPFGPVSPFSRTVAALLAFFFGVLGLHRIYVGKVGTGILQMLTAGGLGLWTLIDFVVILIGGFRDKKGLPLTNW